jgi:hypothetical protein
MPDIAVALVAKEELDWCVRLAQRRRRAAAAMVNWLPPALARRRRFQPKPISL